jgi:hypothetical protein
MCRHIALETARNTIPTHVGNKQLLHVLPAAGDEPQRESRDSKEPCFFKPRYDEAEKNAKRGKTL